jgi:hypothetical protein
LLHAVCCHFFSESPLGFFESLLGLRVAFLQKCLDALNTSGCISFPGEVCGDEIDNDGEGILDNGCASPRTFYFVDQALAADCVGADYNLVSRACGASKATHRGFVSVQSLLKAHTANQITLRPGDTVLVRSGEYFGGIWIPLTASGTADKPLKFTPYNSETATLTLSKTYPDWGTDANGMHTLTLTPQMIASDNLITHSAGVVVIHVIRKNQSGLSQVGSYQELLEKPVLSVDCAGVSGPCRDKLGYGPNLDLKNLDLMYFDSATNTIYANLRQGDSAFSAGDFFVAGPGQRIEVYGNYVEFNGFTVQYGYEIFKNYEENNGLRLRNNLIRQAAGSCVLMRGGNALIEKNRIEYCGSPLAYDEAAGIYRHGQAHAIYYGGVDSVMRDNYLDVVDPFAETLSLYNGTAVQTLPSNTQVYRNIIRNGISVTGIGNKIYNNIVVTKGAYGISIGYGRDHEVHNNLFWTPVPPDTASVVLSVPVTLSTAAPVSGIRFQNNIVMARPSAGDYCLNTNYTDLFSPQTKISHNQYYHCKYFNSRDADQNARVFDTFSAWLSYMNALGLETGSVFGDPGFDSTYHSATASVGVNAGISIPLVTTDYDNNPRPTGSGVDIGPFER